MFAAYVDRKIPRLTYKIPVSFALAIGQTSPVHEGVENNFRRFS
jgi:hypothetical protein